jgi:hypothetical protein
MIALGRIPKARSIHKFGARTGTDTSPATIWDDGLGTYPWSAFDTAQTLTIVGTAPDDVLSVTVLGLDDNYDDIEETIAVGATGNISFKRVYRAYVRGTTANSNVVTIRTGGASGTIVAQINAGYAQTLMCVFTIPRNHKGLLLKGVATASADKDMIIEFYGRFLDENGDYGPFRIQHIANIYQNNYQYEFAIPLAIPEKTDLDVRVRGYSNDSGAKVSAAFDMILYEIDTDY